MRPQTHVLGFVVLLAACGDDLGGGGGSDADSATGGESGPETSVSSGPTSSGHTSQSTQTPSGSTGDIPPLTCSARRHTLLDDKPCGRLGVGDLDADGVDDLLAIEGPISGFFGSEGVDRRMYSYPGVEPLLDTPEIHCCMDAGTPWTAVRLDVNGDGLDDFAVVADQNEVSGDVGNRFEDVTLWIRGPAGGLVSRGRVSRTGFGRGQQVAAGRLFPDGPGLVVAEREALWSTRPEGIDLATAGPTIILEAPAVALGVTDLDGDGIEDVVALLPQSLALVRSVGDGTLEIVGAVATPFDTFSMHLADIDGDDRDDVLLVGTDEIAFAPLEIADLRWSTQSLSIAGPTALADIDDDGYLDLAATDGVELRIHLGSADGGFAAATMTLSNALGEDIVDLKAADFDGDGQSELAVCDAEGILVLQP